MTETATFTAANRAAWDASAAHHRTAAYWRELATGFTDPQFSVFDETLTKALLFAGVEGAKVVQIGCNNGREVLSLCAIGAASGLGIDQSAAFLSQAIELNAIAGHNATFLEADIYALPPDTPRDFDLVLITIGVLNWMPDLPGFFQSVAGLLRPGGRLVIYETHPVLEMFTPDAVDPYTPDTSYFRAEPFIETAAITYDGTTPDAISESYWFVHTLSAIIQGTLDAGLTLRKFKEFPHSIREVDYDLYENKEAQIPMSFLMVATKA